MKRVFTHAAVAALLLVLSGAVSLVRTHQNKMADAVDAFSSLNFDKTVEIYDEVLEDFERWRIPKPLVRNFAASIQVKQDEARYWRKDYDYLVLTLRKVELEKTEVDSRSEFIGTNALYRVAVKETDRRKLVSELTALADRYKKVVDNDPDNLDAAFNYEYLLRLAEEVSSGRRKSLPDSGEEILHGLEGGVIGLKDADKLKIFIPQGDEGRDEKPDAGIGDSPKNKG